MRGEYLLAGAGDCLAVGRLHHEHNFIKARHTQQVCENVEE